MLPFWCHQKSSYHAVWWLKVAGFRELLSRTLVVGSPLEERAWCGGAGGNAAANAIQQECEKQSVLCSVVGIPKSVRRSHASTLQGVRGF